MRHYTYQWISLLMSLQLNALLGCWAQLGQADHQAYVFGGYLSLLLVCHSAAFHHETFLLSHFFCLRASLPQTEHFDNVVCIFMRVLALFSDVSLLILSHSQAHDLDLFLVLLLILNLMIYVTNLHSKPPDRSIISLYTILFSASYLFSIG